MSDFLFHEISEKEKEEIKEQVKKIIDNFSEKLSQVKEDSAEPTIERDDGERVEGEVKCSEIEREIMFNNAPNKNKDFIIGEKKTW